jgi:phage/plasmid-associated DNA primase
MEEFNLQDAIDQLENSNSCFHFRIHPKTQYIFFGDLDNYPKHIDNFIGLLYTFLKDKYNLEFDKDNDFKYTKNNGKIGSYHYSIPKWNLSTEALKEIHTEFLKTYPSEFIVKINKKETYCVDTTIYSEHWFRCPNQSKGDSHSNSVHQIIFGNMEDFIIDYIPSTSINININNNNKKIFAPITKSITDNIQNIILQPIVAQSIVSHPITSETIVPPLLPIANQILPTENQESLLSNEISKVDIYRKLFDECFAPIRFNDYQNWIKVGMAIKNTIIKSDDALQLFIYYSSKGANYEGIETTTSKYNSFKIKYDGYGVGTIYKMAIEDNKNNTIRILSNNKLQFHSTDICRFIKAMAGHRFFYKKENNNYILYCYNGKYWEANDVLLRSFISKELYELLKDILITVYWNSRDFQSYKTKLDKLNNLTFKREIIETYKEYNSRSDIDFDSKWWLFGFNNIVYDMEKCIFREYEYDDYISITTGYNWQEPTEQESTTITNFINSIMPVETERWSFLQILATGIDGRCLEKFIIYNGGGGNGKGVINDCMLEMLGAYGIIGNNNLLFEKSKMGSNPEKANLHKKRYVVFREPPAKAKFENSVIKELTGGGMFSARGHYESNTQKELCNTMICECNEKPAFSDSITQADIRRIIDIYFRSSFKENNNELDISNHIYKANPIYKTREFRDKHKFALFTILTKYHKQFYYEQNSILQVSESIKLRTNLYLESSCDLVAWFQFEYRQDESGDEEISYLRISELYEDFIKSDTYKSISKKEQIHYTRNKFFEKIKNNIFFKKYYMERYNGIRHLLNGWKKIDINIDID